METRRKKYTEIQEVVERRVTRSTVKALSVSPTERTESPKPRTRRGVTPDILTTPLPTTPAKVRTRRASLADTPQDPLASPLRRSRRLSTNSEEVWTPTKARNLRATRSNIRLIEQPVVEEDESKKPSPKTSGLRASSPRDISVSSSGNDVSPILVKKATLKLKRVSLETKVDTLSPSSKSDRSNTPEKSTIEKTPSKQVALKEAGSPKSSNLSENETEERKDPKDHADAAVGNGDLHVSQKMIDINEIEEADNEQSKTAETNTHSRSSQVAEPVQERKDGGLKLNKMTDDVVIVEANKGASPEIDMADSIPSDETKDSAKSYEIEKSSVGSVTSEISDAFTDIYYTSSEAAKDSEDAMEVDITAIETGENATHQIAVINSKEEKEMACIDEEATNEGSVKDPIPKKIDVTSGGKDGEGLSENPLPTSVAADKSPSGAVPRELNSTQSPQTNVVYAKSWNQSIRGPVNKTPDKPDFIDAISVKHSEVTESPNTNTSKSPAIKRVKGIASSSSDEDDEYDEEGDEDDTEAGQFLDNEAMEASDDENSISSGERAYLEENEIPERGESIGSDDTSEEENENDVEADMDSFIVSDSEMDKLSGNDSLCSSDEDKKEDVEQKKQKKYRRIVKEESSESEDKNEDSGAAKNDVEEGEYEDTESEKVKKSNKNSVVRNDSSNSVMNVSSENNEVEGNDDTHETTSPNKSAVLDTSSQRRSLASGETKSERKSLAKESPSKRNSVDGSADKDEASVIDDAIGEFEEQLILESSNLNDESLANRSRLPVVDKEKRWSQRQSVEYKQNDSAEQSNIENGPRKSLGLNTSHKIGMRAFNSSGFVDTNSGDELQDSGETGSPNSDLIKSHAEKKRVPCDDEIELNRITNMSQKSNRSLTLNKSRNEEDTVAQADSDKSSDEVRVTEKSLINRNRTNSKTPSKLTSNQTEEAGNISRKRLPPSSTASPIIHKSIKLDLSLRDNSKGSEESEESDSEAVDQSCKKDGLSTVSLQSAEGAVEDDDGEDTEEDACDKLVKMQRQSLNRSIKNVNRSSLNESVSAKNRLSTTNTPLKMRQSISNGAHGSLEDKNTSKLEKSVLNISKNSNRKVDVVSSSEGESQEDEAESEKMTELEVHNEEVEQDEELDQNDENLVGKEEQNVEEDQDGDEDDTDEKIVELSVLNISKNRRQSLLNVSSKKTTSEYMNTSTISNKSAKKNVSIVEPNEDTNSDSESSESELENIQEAGNISRRQSVLSKSLNKSATSANISSSREMPEEDADKSELGKHRSSNSLPSEEKVHDSSSNDTDEDVAADQYSDISNEENHLTDDDSVENVNMGKKKSLGGNVSAKSYSPIPVESKARKRSSSYVANASLKSINTKAATPSSSDDESEEANVSIAPKGAINMSKGNTSNKLQTSMKDTSKVKNKVDDDGVSKALLNARKSLNLSTTRKKGTETDEGSLKLSLFHSLKEANQSTPAGPQKIKIQVNDRTYMSSDDDDTNSSNKGKQKRAQTPGNISRKSVVDDTSFTIDPADVQVQSTSVSVREKSVKGKLEFGNMSVSKNSAKKQKAYKKQEHSQSSDNSMENYGSGNVAKKKIAPLSAQQPSVAKKLKKKNVLESDILKEVLQNKIQDAVKHGKIGKTKNILLKQQSNISSADQLVSAFAVYNMQIKQKPKLPTKDTASESKTSKSSHQLNQPLTKNKTLKVSTEPTKGNVSLESNASTSNSSNSSTNAANDWEVTDIAPKKRLNVVTNVPFGFQERPATPKKVNGFQVSATTPKSLGWKVRSVLTAGQKEAPCTSKKQSSKKKKSSFSDDTASLSPQHTVWTSSGYFHVSDIDSAARSKKQYRPESHGATTEFVVHPLGNKKRKMPDAVDCFSATALDFKRKAMFNDKTQRESSKDLLRKKMKKKF